MSLMKNDLLDGLRIKPPEEVKTYEYQNISLLKPKSYIVGVECIFSNYHLSIPRTTPPPIKMGKKECFFKADRAMVINPEESVLCTQDAPAKEYAAMFIDKKFVQDIAYNMSGKTQVQFVSESSVVSKRLTDCIGNFEYEASELCGGSSLMLDSISTQIVVQLLREVRSNISKYIETKECNGIQHINKAKEFIEEYYNSNIRLDDLCKIANLSPYHFIRIFKQETGRTPHQYLMDVKINRALQMIKDNQYTISEIALLSGFVSQSHFCTVFKKNIGVSPLIYKKGL